MLRFVKNGRIESWITDSVIRGSVSPSVKFTVGVASVLLVCSFGVKYRKADQAEELKMTEWPLRKPVKGLMVGAKGQALVPQVKKWRLNLPFKRKYQCYLSDCCFSEVTSRGKRLQVRTTSSSQNSEGTSEALLQSMKHEASAGDLIQQTIWVPLRLIISDLGYQPKSSDSSGCQVT